MAQLIWLGQAEAERTQWCPVRPRRRGAGTPVLTRGTWGAPRSPNFPLVHTLHVHPPRRSVTAGDGADVLLTSDLDLVACDASGLPRLLIPRPRTTPSLVTMHSPCPHEPRRAAHELVCIHRDGPVQGQQSNVGRFARATLMIREMVESHTRVFTEKEKEKSEQLHLSLFPSPKINSCCECSPGVPSPCHPGVLWSRPLVLRPCSRAWFRGNKAW